MLRLAFSYSTIEKLTEGKWERLRTQDAVSYFLFDSMLLNLDSCLPIGSFDSSLDCSTIRFRSFTTNAASAMV
jgi:hypothetical protein